VAKSEWNEAIEQAIARSSAEFFQRLVEALAERGVASTRSAIADLLDLRPATIAAWASGKATPAVDRVVDLARASGIDLDWLLTGVGSPWQDAELDELVRRFRGLSPSGRAFVLEAARMASRRGGAHAKKKSTARKSGPRRKRAAR
jgi:transcriptional regulator with XRE-family HTH domain